MWLLTVIANDCVWAWLPDETMFVCVSRVGAVTELPAMLAVIDRLAFSRLPVIEVPLLVSAAVSDALMRLPPVWVVEVLLTVSPLPVVSPFALILNALPLVMLSADMFKALPTVSLVAILVSPVLATENREEPRPLAAFALTPNSVPLIGLELVFWMIRAGLDALLSVIVGAAVFELL